MSNDGSGGHGTPGGPSRRSVIRGGAVALAGTGLTALASGPAIAGDQLAVFRPDPHSLEPAPGETVEVDVEMQSQGGHGGEGVVSIEFIVQYHPDHVEVVDIEPGTWLEQGEETEILEDIHYYHEAGTAILEQERKPAEGGATGRDHLATVTLDIADDAPVGETLVTFGNSEVYLERQFQLPVHHQEVTLAVGGEDEQHEEFDHPDPTDREALEAATESGSDGEDDDDDGDGSQDDGSETEDGSGTDPGGDDGDSSTDNGSDEQDDETPGPGVLAALAGVGGGAYLYARHDGEEGETPTQ